MASTGQDIGAVASAGAAPLALAAIVPVALLPISVADASDSDNIGTAAFLKPTFDDLDWPLSSRAKAGCRAKAKAEPQPKHAEQPVFPHPEKAKSAGAARK